MDITCKKCGTAFSGSADATRQLHYRQCRQVFSVTTENTGLKCPHCGAAQQSKPRRNVIERELPTISHQNETTAGSLRGLLGIFVFTLLLSAAVYHYLVRDSGEDSATASVIVEGTESNSTASPAPANSIKQPEVTLATTAHDNVPEVKGLERSEPETWMEFVAQHMDAESQQALKLPKGARLTSTFGYRIDPFRNTWRFHHGLDIAMKMGTPVKALLPGKVLFTGYSQDYGRVIFVEHPHGLVTIYGHLSKSLVKEGQEIAHHQVIGNVGSTGRSTGPHLHFEVRLRNKHVDPTMIPQFKFLTKKAPSKPMAKKRAATAPKPAVRG